MSKDGGEELVIPFHPALTALSRFVLMPAF